ncbi:MAG: universal stress protein [Caulobacteraceae bacterium]|nr:universal stress protein [Caulobacteraceae bacterium]MBK8544045.1 universal stress protein [Caulobacteraceae bacterium]MBP6690066.1 universal stress protein [Hyphomonadaceae bacterium]
MSWKDVLVIVSEAEADEPAIALGEILAGLCSDCHLSAAFLTPLPDEPLAYEPTVVAGVWAELLGRARQEAEVERKKVEARLQRSGKKAELRGAEALSRDLGRVAAVHARYADVAVMTRPSEGAGVELREEIIEGVLFHSGRPALIAPPGWTGSTVGKRVIVAWDASREATRALSEADDLLENAEAVTVLTVDAKPKMFGHGDQPGSNIAGHLNRRGLPAEVRNVDSAGRSASSAILEEAHKFNADLIVMGGYAHSRLRELVFGGATRELLRTTTVPLLMAH